MNEKFALLLGYFEKQHLLIERLYSEIIHLDLLDYDKRFVFALRVQQFYTALEDLFKQIAKSFENHIENLQNYHKELLIRMNTEIPKMRPAVLSTESFVYLDKVRAFRHFIRHAYDCELDLQELNSLQSKLKHQQGKLLKDLNQFRAYLETLTQ